MTYDFTDLQKDLVSALDSFYCSLSEYQYSSIFNMIEAEVIKSYTELREIITAYTSPQ